MSYLILILTGGAVVGFLGKLVFRLKVSFLIPLVVGIAGTFLAAMFYAATIDPEAGSIGAFIFSFAAGLLLTGSVKLFTSGTTGPAKPQDQAATVEEKARSAVESSQPVALAEEVLRERIEAAPVAAKLSFDEGLRIKELIAENRLLPAIGELQQMLQTSRADVAFFDELIVLKSQLNQVQASVRKGILTHTEETIETNKIRDHLLAIVNRLL